MKLICFLCLIVLVASEPQLDIPRVQSTSVPKKESEGPLVLVLPNSYTDDKLDVQTKSDSNLRFDSDRSQRYGVKHLTNQR
jgi:hypothetical protein